MMGEIATPEGLLFPGVHGLKRYGRRLRADPLEGLVLPVFTFNQRGD